MAYYGNLTEQELGFDAFIAPDDFDRTAQPVDIYEVFKREYALNPQARYIYYYSDGNYPLTLTPTADEYYRYGHRNGGVDVIYDVPLSSEGGVATTIWGASGNTSGGDESGFTHRWVVVYRVSTAKFTVVIGLSGFKKSIWIYAGIYVDTIRFWSPRYDYSAEYLLKYIHYANINSLTGNIGEAYLTSATRLLGRAIIPETVTTIGYDAFSYAPFVTKYNFPYTKNIAMDNRPGFNAITQEAIEINYGASTSIPTSEQQSQYSKIAIISVSQQNTSYASFENCDIIYTKDLTTIHWLAPKTVRGLYLPDQLPQSQIDLLGTKLQANIMQNHQLYIGDLITDLTNLYLANKSFVTIEVGAGNTAFVVENGILYNSAKTQLIKAGTYNTGDLIIPNTVTEILADSFLRCSGYTGNLTLPPNYDTSIYRYFGFANFSTESLNTSILNLMGGTSGSPKWFFISKTSLDALNAAYPDAVSNAVLRFINVVGGIIQDASQKIWLDASNTLSYPGTGTLWSDLSGNGNNGTMINGVAYSTANGGVMNFDGVNDYVISNIPKTDYGAEFSIYMWVNMQGSQNAVGIWQAASTLGDPAPWILCQRTTTGFRLYLNGSYGVNITVPNSIPFQMGLQFKGGVWEILVNGIVVQTQTKPIGAMGANSLYLGNGYGGYFNGQINDVAIYNRVLTPEEVNYNFNITRGKYNI